MPTNRPRGTHSSAVSDWEIFTARIQGGNVTPMTYRVSATGKQYLVIAAGGHPKITEEKLGDSLSAFALP